MSLGDRLYEIVTGYEPAATPTVGGWRDMVGELVRAHGSERAASAAVGVNRRTWQRARAAEAAGRAYNPRPGTVEKLIAGVRGARVLPDYPGDKAVVLHVTEWRAGKRDATERDITGRQMNLRPGTMRQVAEAYRRTGDPQIMALAFLQGVRDGFYRAALGAGVDTSPTGPVDAPGDDEGDEGEAETLDDMYEDYDGPHDLDDVEYDDGFDATSYGFDVA